VSSATGRLVGRQSAKVDDHAFYSKGFLVTDPFFAGVDLARTLEGTESHWAAAYAESLARLRPGSDFEVIDVAGGRAVFVGVNSPLSEAKALGFSGPVTDDDFERLEAVYAPRHAAVKVVVCPLADASLWTGLGRRGYRPSEFESLLVRPITASDQDLMATAPGVEVRPCAPDEESLYCRVVAPNFFGEGELPDDQRDLFTAMSGVPGYIPYLGFVEGQPAGGGALLVFGRLALLAGAATLPPFRNRGLHAALSRARFAEAGRRGCTLAVQGALPGSTSQRNAERLGYRVAYTKLTMMREPS
jgi:GNAT superfamily N-acetyltransferase